MDRSKILSTVAAMLVAANLTSCGQTAKLLTPVDITLPAYSSVEEGALSDFALKLFSACHKSGENTLVSPLSVAYALGMTSLGAKGDTLSQIESLFGIDREALASSLSSVASTLEKAEDSKNHTRLADSVWIRDYYFTPDADFIKNVGTTYAADIFSAPFDSSTCKDINSWVKRKTEGTIDKILDEIPEDAVMYLVNTLFFEAEWAEVYKSDNVMDGKFTSYDGTVSDVKMMSSSENEYLSGEGFTGFIKYYKGGKFGFAAILPDEGKTVQDVIGRLDGAALTKLLSKPEYTSVSVLMPKFSFEYDIELSETLEGLGVTDAFDSELADFSGLGKSPRGNIYMSRVLHKTFVEVAEKGTKAGAATIVEMVDECALLENRAVTLDRPFAFVIFETTDNTPLFIGTLENAENIS